MNLCLLGEPGEFAGEWRCSVRRGAHHRRRRRRQSRAEPVRRGRVLGGVRQIERDERRRRDLFYYSFFFKKSFINTADFLKIFLEKRLYHFFFYFTKILLEILSFKKIH